MKRILGIIFVLAMTFSVSAIAGDDVSANKEVKTDKVVQTATVKTAPMSRKQMKCKKDCQKPCCKKMAEMKKDCLKVMADKKACCKKMAAMKKDCPKVMADKTDCCEKMAEMKKDCPKAMKCKKDCKKPCCSKKLPAKAPEKTAAPEAAPVPEN
ncbi:MAG: hypothetical protein DRJ14_05510 [Acidobacteria bacterium]|nr:MAG: hypothetical protein DRJ14_05510 [Acidobacteriota bacterium]